MRKFVRCLVALCLAVVMVFALGSPAFASSSDTYFASYFSFPALVRHLMETDQTLTKAELDEIIATYWTSSVPADQYEIAPDDFWTLYYDTISAGYPCEIVFNSSVGGYVIKGTGSFTCDAYALFGLTQAYSKSINGCYLTNGHGSVLFCPYDSMGSMTNLIRQSLLRIEGYVDGLETALSTANSHLSSIKSWSANIGGYLDGVEGLLSGQSAKLDTLIDTVASSLFTQAYLVSSDSVVHSQRTVPYEVATAIVSDVNVRFWGRDLTVYASDGVGHTFRFCHAYMNAGFIYVQVENSSGGQFACYLCDEQGNIYRYSNPVYSASLSSILSAVQALEDKLDSMVVGDVNVEAEFTADFSTLEDALDQISGQLDDITDKMDKTVTDVEINIDVDNDAYDVFYVDSDDGTQTSIVDLTGSILEIVGDMLNFVYDVGIEGAISSGGGVNLLRDFYFGTGIESGVDVWS